MDYGPKPFRFFNSWLRIPGFCKMVEERASNFSFIGAADKRLTAKLKWLKFGIKDWIHEKRQVENQIMRQLQEQINDLDGIAESRGLSDVELETRLGLKKRLQDRKNMETLNLKQRARIKWSVEGDENYAFFHGIINSNTKINRINGMQINGVWERDPAKVKRCFFNAFKERFSEAMVTRPSLKCQGGYSLDVSQAQALIIPFSVEELGNGHDIKFWVDRWVGEVPLNRRFPNLFDNSMLKSGVVASFFTKRNGEVRWNWRWKRQLSGVGEMREFSDLLSVLANCVPRDREDEWVWEGAMEGVGS
ncbi:hypothetical protein SSX86_019675 [Deinandra increscens subsp. villosa]|uniref:Reverse transcriptase n=1 Tax=Deinandra increscens subsp. villosa TaxID=3103831 RepID=A0AAP0GT92_9ASTR